MENMEHKKCWIGVVMTMLVLLNGLGWSQGCVDQEREALLQLKPCFNFLNWPESSNSPECCEWEMVECNATTGRITKLSLVPKVRKRECWYLNVSYFLPFEQLTSLNLSQNFMRDCVENQGFEILWLRLRKLEILDLSSNYFNESIMSSLSGFSSLKSLYLNDNEMGTTLNGSGFESLWRLSNLELLDLEGNYFNNSIMSSLRGLSSLKDLNLARNNLSGTIDMEGYLEVLDLSYNRFNNSVFASLNGLSNLKSLDLSGNQLTGSVHLKVLANLGNLEELQLNDNKIEEIAGPKDKTASNKLKVIGLANLKTNSTRTVLKSLGALSTLKTIDLRGNVLNETNTFQELFNLSTLEELFLDDSSLPNYFLQTHVRSSTSLKVLRLNSCHLKGTLPDQGWCDLKNLEELDLGFNELEGTLPPCLANLSSIRVLDLSYNQFTGTLPPCLANLSSIRVLDLSYNQFTGNIASTPLPNLKSIESLSLKNNHFQVSLKPFANHSSLKVFLASNGNDLIDKASSEPWTPKFQLEALNLANCITKNSNANSVNFLYNQFNLRYLDLSSSQFGGAFPSWLFENNTRLQEIYLNNNSFVGPFQLSSHPNPNISLIDISQNKILGQIPSNISFIFPNLVLLNISKNSFHGTIPPMGGTKSLKFLDFSNNQLSGEIKEQFANNSLQFIVLSDNNFSGYIPNLFNPFELGLLLLDGNHFVGEMPDLSSFTDLTLLDISRNSLTGNLPSWTANMLGLWEISMSDNKFEGSIPLEFCKLYYLRFLDLSRNDLSGTVPPCFSELTNLQHVLLSRNKLGGAIPHAFINSIGLRVLDLGGNNFNGTIPNWIGNLSSLTVLLLHANNFHGDIPIELCHLKQLNILAIFSNNMSGGLHPCLSNLSSIAPDEVSYQETFYVDYISSFPNFEEYTSDPSGFSSPIQEFLEFRTKSNSLFYTGYILDHMYGIDLSCNRFSGEIPIEFGNLRNVRSLNLSHNNLIGVIPATFSKLKQLESLDLSYNDLTGQIPPQLTEINSLEVFTVAHNNLSGAIPTKNQFGTFIESSYKGNLHLCGPPLNKSCHETNVASPATYHEDDSFMEMTDFWVSFVVAYAVILLSMAIVLYINSYSRQVWFYHIEVGINICYYFVVDKFQ